MTGRHRRTQMSNARRALAAGVPALGLVGAVTALGGAEAETASVAEASGSVAPDGPVSAAAVLPAAAPTVTTVADDAARVAGRAGDVQRESERQELRAVVADVRADAQERRESAAALGQEELAAFERDQQRQQQESTPEREPETVDDRGDTGRQYTDDEYCDTSGPALFGDRVDADEIVSRDCGLTDLLGRERSSDSWIDGQLLSAIGE